MKITLTSLLLAAVALGLSAQDAPKPKPKPAPAPPPAHRPDLSKLDERNDLNINEALRIAREADARIKAAEKEGKRKGKDPSQPPAVPAAAKDAVEELKKKAESGELDDLKSAIEESREELRESSAKLVDKVKDANSKRVPPAPNTPGTPAGPASADRVAAPKPLAPPEEPPVRKVKTSISSDTMIKPPTRDPANPDRVLPKSDPRGRTWVLTGNARVRTSSFALDADRIDVLYAADSDGPGLGTAPKKKPAVKSVDPVVPGAGEPADGAGRPEKKKPVERMVATGRAKVLMLGKDGLVQYGRGGVIIYERATGLITLKDWPEAQSGTQGALAKSKGAIIQLSETDQFQSDDCTIETVTPMERAEIPHDTLSAVPERARKAAAIPVKSASPSSGPR